MIYMIDMLTFSITIVSTCFIQRAMIIPWDSHPDKARAQKWCIDSVTGNVRRCTDPKVRAAGSFSRAISAGDFCGMFWKNGHPVSEMGARCGNGP